MEGLLTETSPSYAESGLYEVVAFCDIIIERAQETKENLAQKMQKYLKITVNF